VWKTIFALVIFASTSSVACGSIVYSSFNAFLTTGSLTGTQFPVSFSYDDAQVSPIGPSYLFLNSFDFTLDGFAFSKAQIFQGGQVIFIDGVLVNVTASYQVTLPPSAPVENITFGFGGDGVIGYIDDSRNFGSGTFTFTPEPSSLFIGAATVMLVWRRTTAGR
jgi:hypothetical protein